MILNLVNPESTDIRYEVSKFPDGQQSLKIKTSDVQSFGFKPITIYSRMNSFLDLELIICATKALRYVDGVKNIQLYIPYFLGGRSDRKFSAGGVNYIKDVIAPIINSLNFDKVTVMDCHSDVIEACINNLNKVDNVEVVSKALKTWGLLDENNLPKENLLLISPDAGALKKIYHVAELIGYKNDIVIAAKHRDLSTGKITHTSVPMEPNYVDKDMVIIDDVCDGGRTFIEIAKVIKNYVSPKDEFHNRKLYLITTHGIYSSGFKELNNWFDGIFSTNSVVDMNNPMFVARNQGDLDKLSQLNVF
jgi:ribose-phosphate pyrophosphokinase